MKEDKRDNSRNKVSLKLVQVDIEGAIEAEGCGDGETTWVINRFEFVKLGRATLR
jgi:hypothetical protein